MVRLLIIRHGYSESNKQGRFAGRMDFPLDERGKKQAQQCAEYISENYKIDKIYSSDLARAYDTARPLSALTGAELITDQDLREIFVGEWEGMLISEVKAKYPESYEKFRNNDDNFRYEGGESCEEVSERVKKVFGKIIAENEGKTVAVATHGGIVRAILTEWYRENGEIFTAIVPNASVTVAEYENGRIKITTVGYDGYVKEKVPAFGEGV